MMLALVAILCLGAAEEEEGDQSPSYETVVRDKKGGGIEAQRRIDAAHPGFATAIDLEDDAGARSADALPEVLARSPGATVRSIGGLGQYSSISIRGSSAQQVALFMDGVPVCNNTAGLTSLADFPLDALGRIEVYRGYVPVSFGSGAIGGAVNLVGKIHRGSAQGSAVADWGSFGAHAVRLGYSQPLGDHHSLTTRIGHAAARGDFPFYDTKNTPAIHGDDELTIRQNNGYQRLLAQVRLDGEADEWRYGLQQLTLIKHQGIPGPATAQSTTTTLDTLNLKLLGSAKRSVLGPGGYFSVVFGAGFDRLHFRDPDVQVGPGEDDEVTLGLDLFLSPTLRFELWPSGFLTATVDLRFEHRSLDSAIEGDLASGDAERIRGSYGAGLELEQFLFGNRLHLAPVVRIDLADSRFAVPPGQGEVNDLGTDHLSWSVSPRAAARFTVIDGVQIRASFGRYFRPPTVLELFGDRGYLVGNEGLEPEQGLALDAGLVTDLTFGPLAFYLHAAGFATWSEDLITWVPSANQVRPMNLAGAEVAGLESSLILGLFGERFRLHATYTFLDSRNQSPEEEQTGKPLPGRVQHDLFTRLTVGEAIDLASLRAEGRVFYNLDFLSGSFLDLSGRYGLPPRGIHGLGAEIILQPRGARPLEIRLAIEVRNLTDLIQTAWQPPIINARPRRVPVTDFIGYPLPGRSFWLSLVITGPVTSQEEDSS